jgi:hypothetical protein
MNYSKPAVGPAWGESNTTPADMVQPTNAQIQQGWPLSATPPPRQYFNWILYWCAAAIRYFMQRGLVDYDPTETYQIGARVIGDDGNTYTSLIVNNTANTPSASPASWGLWGLTIAQINASQLTQATQAPGDSSTKVSNDAFVTRAIATLAGQLTQTSGSNANGHWTKDAETGHIHQWGQNFAAPGTLTFPIPFTDASSISVIAIEVRTSSGETTRTAFINDDSADNSFNVDSVFINVSNDANIQVCWMADGF